MHPTTRKSSNSFDHGDPNFRSAREGRLTTASFSYSTGVEDDVRSDFGFSEESDDFIESAETIERRRELRQPETRGATFVRAVALLCACSLSIGSHYAAHILGPLKSQLHQQLGTSHTEFGLLLSAYSLNSTWTPFVGGVLTSRLGTTSMSIWTTGVILVGQIFVLLGDTWGSLRLMALGLFVFGLGVSPVSVVQETIIVRFFKTHGLGVTMAMGLFAGKVASFLAARTAYPLTEHFGPRAPFYVSTLLAAFSVFVNLIYISLSRRLVALSGAELEAADISSEAHRRFSSNVAEGRNLEEVVKKRQVHMRQIVRFGDVFWAYIALNVFCGFIWSPFTQLSANIIEMRYDMSEEASTNTASYLLSGPVLLYPVCGYIVDKRKHSPIIIQLLLLSSFMTLLAYIWLALPPGFTYSPIPSIISFAFALGFSPLLLVVMVPRIVPSEYVSTALGAHKSMEQTGSILLQTLSGILLDIKSGKRENNSLQYLLNTFVFLNVLQGGSIWFFAYLQYKMSPAKTSRRDSFAMESFPNRTESHVLSETNSESTAPLLNNDNDSTIPGIRTLQEAQEVDGNGTEVRRGKIIACACITFVVLAWVLVMALALNDFEQSRDGK